MYNKIILIARFYVLVERNTSLLLPIKQVREGINFHRSNFEAKKKNYQAARAFLGTYSQPQIAAISSRAHT